MDIFRTIWHSTSIRLRRRLIVITYHAMVVLVSFAGFEVGLSKLSTGLLLADILTFRIMPVSKWFEETLLPEARCFGCGNPVSMVSAFRCGCGFVPYKERHVFSPCPECGKTFAWITCPECETSIPI